jgi:hypothetical protein
MVIQKIAIAYPHQSPMSLEACWPCHGLDRLAKLAEEQIADQERGTIDD